MEAELEISSFFQYVSNPVVYLSPSFCIKKINQSSERLFDITETNWLEVDYADFAAKISGVPSVSAVEKALNQGSIVRESGWHIQLLTRKDGLPVGLVLIFENHNEHAESAIHDVTSPTFNPFEKESPCYTYWKDSGGVYLGCNQLLAELVGFSSSKDIVGRTDFDLPWKSTAKRLQKNDKSVMNAASKEIFYEEVFLGKQAGKKIFLFAEAPLMNHKKEVVGVTGIALDVSEQPGASEKLPKSREKIAEDERQFAEMAKEIMGGELNCKKTPLEHLKSIKNYYDGMIASMPGNVYWTDKDSLQLGCNDNVLKMLGMKSRDEYSGITYAEMAKIGGWRKGQVESFQNDDIEVMKTGRPRLNIEEPPISDVYGNLIYFLSNRVPIRNENSEIIGVLGISIDITARKKAEFALQKAKDDAEAAREKAEQASQAKSNFLAVMSHELRTPLNAILGLAQIIKNGDRIPEDKIHEYGETIQRSGKELLTLISDVLEYSRAEAGQLRIEEELVDVPDLVNGVREKLANKASGKGLSLIVNVDERLPRNMITDAQRLRQILTNLTDNAIKYSREGTVELAVNGKKNDDQQKFDVEFSIKDAGIGIPKDQQATIFDEFTQVSSDQAKQYARKHGGVGLGLSIVKRFVDQMGGKIDFSSEENKGTTFHCRFTFPLPTDDRENAGKFKALSGIQVLFVDDSKVRREHWQRKLLSWGFRVVASTHARAMKEMSDSYDRGSAFPIVITSRECESEKLRALTQQMVSEPRFNDILHVAVFEGAASLPETELRKCGYSVLIQNCHQPSDFVDPFLEAWHRHQLMLAGGDEVSLVGRRILLVEDNQLNQRVAQLLLADLKCEIDVADDGESALKKLNENTYDLVLMDVGLPDINGLEVTEKFRQAYPDSGLPIIALTAHALVEDKQRCFDAGMDDYAVKPLDADKLKNTIRRWVKQKHFDK